MSMNHEPFPSMKPVYRDRRTLCLTAKFLYSVTVSITDRKYFPIFIDGVFRTGGTCTLETCAYWYGIDYIRTIKYSVFCMKNKVFYIRSGTCVLFLPRYIILIQQIPTSVAFCYENKQEWTTNEVCKAFLLCFWTSEPVIALIVLHNDC